MKMNSPVQCRSFFADQIEHSPEKIWCVSLKPNGQILSLIEAKWTTEAEKRITAGTLLRQSINHQNKQLLIVRINPQHLFFDADDWANVKTFKKLSDSIQFEFVDYMKIGREGYCSLINYDY